MIRIGDLSKLSFVPVKTLRYYDEINLLKPVQVDPFTNYRYYSAEQLPRLHRILALKELGLSLEEIRTLLDSGLPAEQMVGMLRRKAAQLQVEISHQQEQFDLVQARLRQFEKEFQMTTKLDVVIKSIPELKVASLRGMVPTYAEQGILWEQLESAIQKSGLKIAGPCLTIDHDSEYRSRDHDLEVCEPVTGSAELEPPCVLKVLPAVESMACAIHHGVLNDLHQAYQVMLEWLAGNNYQIVGSGRELYLKSGESGVAQDDSSYVTEIQFPVVKMK